MPVGIWFFLLAKAQYNFSFMNKISAPIQEICSSEALQSLCQQGDEICYKYNKIC